MVHSTEHLSPLGHSDHEVLVWSFVYSTNCLPSFSKIPKEVYKYSHGDYNQMNEYYLSVDWEVLLQEANTIENNWTVFKNEVISATHGIFMNQQLVVIDDHVVQYIYI